uniref:Uncharacterized protein n=1 Tax=Parascaris equorum TaxID=6256 RepID=A0A914R4W7_PAREQ
MMIRMEKTKSDTRRLFIRQMKRLSDRQMIQDEVLDIRERDDR